MRNRSIGMDAAKGGFVVAMIAYHACYVAVMFGFSDIDLFSGFWWIFPRTIAAGFVALSGWNLASKRARGGSLKAFARRAGQLALVALAISAATYPVLRSGFVFFGVIHLLAVSSLLAYPLLGRPAAAIAVGAAFLAAGLAVGGERFGFPWLAWLGLRPANLYPADYLPLAPWFAFAAFGAAARDLIARAGEASREAGAGKAGVGKAGADKATRKERAGGASSPAPAALRALAFLGRHSLAVYLIHLPLLYGLGWAVSAALGKS